MAAAQPGRDSRQHRADLNRGRVEVERDATQLRQDVAEDATPENGSSEILRILAGSLGDLRSALGAIVRTAVRLGPALGGFRSAVLDPVGRES